MIEGIEESKTMKAVMAEVPPDILDWRKKCGADQWDEIWEGVLHMPLAPNRDHQDLEWELETWLRTYWARPKGNWVFHQINLVAPGGWPKHNYRIPDLVLLTPDRFDIDHNEYFEGAPAVVVEIHSSNDEAYDKLSFFAELGVPEVWIIHRDTYEPFLFALQDDGYQQEALNENGWLCSRVTGVEMRPSNDKLLLRLDGDDATEEELPHS